jgi:hypothetical protein
MGFFDAFSTQRVVTKAMMGMHSGQPLDDAVRK